MLYKKHSPGTVEEAIGLDAAYNDVKKWVLSWKKGRKNNFLIIHGPPGTGKNILVDMVARDLKKEKVFFESGYLDALGKEQFRQQSLMHNGKLIIADEPNSMRGLSDLIDASSFPVIILTDDLYKPALRTYRAKGTKVAISRPRYDSIAKRLHKICAEEKMMFDDKTILEIARKCKGDVRAALLDLETVSNGSYSRDVNENVFNTLKTIFSSFDEQAIREAVANCDKPLNELFWWIENNIYRHYRDADEIARAYEYMALADFYNSRIMKRQSWGLMKYLNSLAVIGVAFSKKPRNSFGFVRYMPPMARSRKKELDPIKHKIAHRLHTSSKKADLYLPIIRMLAKEDKEGVAQEFNFDKDDLKLLK